MGNENARSGLAGGFEVLLAVAIRREAGVFVRNAISVELTSSADYLYQSADYDRQRSASSGPSSRRQNLVDASTR